MLIDRLCIAFRRASFVMVLGALLTPAVAATDPAFAGLTQGTLSSSQAQAAAAAAAAQAASMAATAPSTAMAFPSATTTPIPPSPQAKVASVQPAQPQYFDYSTNLVSEAFGAQLFSGSFAREGAARFNPDYAISVGDQVQVRLWGAIDFDQVLNVDPQGNLFLPQVGPVRVLGVRNQELQRVVEAAVEVVFRANVSAYASLAAAQPVRVFVSGFVHRPGLYSGTSMDSLLHYLDQAGGIDPERGSFLAVKIKRGKQVRATINLYDFLLNGTMPQTQLADGDVILVEPRGSTVKVSGLAENAKRIEIGSAKVTLKELSRIAKPRPETTHVRVIRNTGTVRNVEYFPIEDAARITLHNGDELEFTADKKPGTITVRVEGEHESAQEYVMPHGARLRDLMSQIVLSERSDGDSIQLFRKSVQVRQKEMLQIALQSLENAVLTARSETNDEAQLRKEEAALILQWVERAKLIEPKGQVLVAASPNRGDLLLESGDIIRIPARDGLVLVSGEVLFPNAVAFQRSLALDNYIAAAGGYTQNADVSRVVVAHADGSFTDGALLKSGGGRPRGGVPTFWWEEQGASGDAAANTIRPGDDILVLPRIDVKSTQITKDLTQIIYQLAVVAKVVFDL